MELFPVEGYRDEGKSAGTTDYCQLLEEGNILFFEKVPFALPEGDREFLLSQQQTGAQFHKNIAYRPHLDRITGFKKCSETDGERLLGAMRRYSQAASSFVEKLLPQYARGWRVDYASFRPQEEEGREVRLRARNDLLHIDSFPTRPTKGDRILRFFTNINPSQSRHWRTADPFPKLVEHLRNNGTVPPDLLRSPGTAKRFTRYLKGHLSRLGLSLQTGSDYDDFMLGLHHFLKERPDLMNGFPTYSWDFPPGSSWMVFTDLVPHAALSGRFALEQTLIVARDTQALPEKSPLAIFEELRKSVE